MPFWSFELVVRSRAAAGRVAGVDLRGSMRRDSRVALFGRTNAGRWDGSADRAGYDLAGDGMGQGRLVLLYPGSF